MAIPFQQMAPPHDRAPGGRVAPVTPWLSTLARAEAQMQAAPRQARGVAHTGRDSPEADQTERRRFLGGHLLIRIIGHGRNGTLGLVRRAGVRRVQATVA